MSDAALQDKFAHLSEAVIGATKTRQLIEACWQLGASPNVNQIVALMQP